MKRFISLVLALSVLGITLCACDEQTVLDTLEDIFGETEQVNTDPAKNEPTSELTKELSFVTVATENSEIPDNVLDFSIKLFDKCADDDNIVTSPYSVIYSLAMAQKGASGKTLSEFEKLLGVKKDELENYLKASVSNKGDELMLGSSVWIRNNFKENVREDYLKGIKQSFASEVFSAAFDGETLNDINAYISEKTNGLIENALDEINPYSVMFLINTVYFKANWYDVYLDSVEGIFTNIDGTESTAQFLHSQEYSYISDGKAQGFIKNYAGGRYAFAAILPNEGVGLNDYVSTLTGKKLKKMLSQPEQATVNAKLPKFETEYKNELQDIIREMGLKRAFTFGKADFSNMVTEEAVDLVYLSRIIHDATIRVDNTGTEAAAVTIFDIKFGAAAMSEPEEIKTVHLDRPFMYIIFDTASYTPVFIGQITNF